ncbi:MAG: tetratricopeptide repeat protein [Myxococcales bacterium]|nr:tetratricopeptide repeat protein [Myxococcales bacterium]
MTAAAKFAAKGQHDRAAKEYVTIIEADPADLRSWLLLAEALANAGDKAGAIERYIHVGKHYADANEGQKAIAVYRKVLALDANRLDVQSRIASIYNGLGRINDAVAAYEFVAQAYFQSGQIAEGLEGFRMVAELEPGAVGKRLRLAELYSREGMVAQAVEHFRLAAERLLADRRTDDYIRVAERLIYHKEDDLPVLRSLAQIYLKQGENRRALVKLNALLRAAPADAEGLELLGDTFVAIGKVDKAVSVVMELAREQRKGGRKAKETAARVLRKALAWSPENAEDIKKIIGEVEAEIAALPVDPKDRDEDISLDVDVVEEEDKDLDLDVDVVEDEERKVEEVPSRPFAPVGANVAPGAAEVLEDNVGDVEKVLLEARVYVKYKMYEHALGHLDLVFLRDANHTPALELQAQILSELQRGPEAADAYVRLAQLVSGQNIRLARDYLARAQKLAPDHTRAEMVLAAIDSNGQPSDEAASLLKGLHVKLDGENERTPDPTLALGEAAARDEAAAHEAAAAAAVKPRTKTEERAAARKADEDKEAADKAAAEQAAAEAKVAADRAAEEKAAADRAAEEKAAADRAAEEKAAADHVAEEKAAADRIAEEKAAADSAAEQAASAAKAAEEKAAADVAETPTEANTGPEGQDRSDTSEKPGEDTSGARPRPGSLSSLEAVTTPKPASDLPPVTPRAEPTPLPISPLATRFSEKTPLPRAPLGARFGEKTPLPVFKRPPAVKTDDKPEDEATAGEPDKVEAEAKPAPAEKKPEAIKPAKRPELSKKFLKSSPKPEPIRAPAPSSDREDEEIQPDDSGVIEMLDAEEMVEVEDVVEVKAPPTRPAPPPSKRPPAPRRAPPARPAPPSPEKPADAEATVEEQAPAKPEVLEQPASEAKYEHVEPREPEAAKPEAAAAEQAEVVAPASQAATGEAAKPEQTEADVAAKAEDAAKPESAEAIAEEKSGEPERTEATDEATTRVEPAGEGDKAEGEEPAAKIEGEKLEAEQPAAEETEPEKIAAERPAAEVTEPETTAAEPSVKEIAAETPETETPAAENIATEAPAGAAPVSEAAPSESADEAPAAVDERAAEQPAAEKADERPAAVEQAEPAAEKPAAVEQADKKPDAGDTAMMAIDAVLLDGEAAEGKSAPIDYPDITDEVEELRFFISGRFDDDAQFAYLELQRRFPGHPALAEFADRFAAGAKLESASAPVVVEDLPATRAAPAVAPATVQRLEEEDDDDFLASIFSEPASRTIGKATQPTRAKADLEDGADAQTFFDLGTAYREMGLDDDALAQFELAAKDPRWTSRARIMMASLRAQRGDNARAVADLETAIEHAADDDERSEARYELGVLFQTTGDDARAVEVLQQVTPGYRDRDERLAELGG